jgi:hypothetical protein
MTMNRTGSLRPVRSAVLAGDRDTLSFGDDRDRQQAVGSLIERQRIMGIDPLAVAPPLAESCPCQFREQSGSPIGLKRRVDDFHRCAQGRGRLGDALMGIACGIGSKEIRRDHDLPDPGRSRPTSSDKERVRRREAAFHHLAPTAPFELEVHSEAGRPEPLVDRDANVARRPLERVRDGWPGKGDGHQGGGEDSPLVFHSSDSAPSRTMIQHWGWSVSPAHRGRWRRTENTAREAKVFVR